MKEWIDQADEWFGKGDKVALATVVKVSGSAPRPVGAKMIISSSEQIAGSVSGGCVETSVAQEALEVIDSGQPRLLYFGITDEMGWDVGLACGGEIHVLVEYLDPAFFQTIKAIRRDNKTSVVTTIIKPEDTLGQKVVFELSGDIKYSTIKQEIPDLQDQIKQAIENGKPGTASIPDTDQEIYIEPQLSKPLLIIIGGVHIAVSLMNYAKELGFRVIVADPRSAFASKERFPLADEILVEWPDEALSHINIDQETYIVILTHDPKIDEPALTNLLGLSDDNSPKINPSYIGAIGSRNTHAKRFDRLKQLGVTPEQLGKVYAPIGLDLGGTTPPETALSIMAEIIAVKNGRTGGSLRKGKGRIGAG